MPDIPAHPDTGTDLEAEAAAVKPRWKTALWIAAVVAVLALFIVLHLTGVVGAESHK
ncbi:MAG: hypothetical protein HOW97_03515 [Catenulispora sp.]|nr:hypothetical protein [Catenulispora sp.]NUR60272.1 hypothetical protein [Catenulispora sp.]